MKSTEIILDVINTLSDFYVVLDTNALFLEKDHHTIELLLKYKNKTESDDERQKLQWELEALLFSFKGNRLFCFSTSNGKEPGEVAEYPQFDNFQQEAFDYLKQRSELSTSALLRARYNHLLWVGLVKKNTVFLIQAAKSYIEAINNCCQLAIGNDFEYSYLLGVFYENLIGIVDEGKVQIEETKQITSFLLFNSPKIPFWSKHGIIDDMLKYPKIFKPVDFEKVLTLFDIQLKNKGGNTDDFSLVHYHLPTAIRVAQKTKADIKKWYNEIGFAYLRMTEKETDSTRNWIKLDLYRAAIDAFRQSGNLKKKEEAEQLYFELKPEVQLNDVRIDFDEETRNKLQELQNEIKEKALTLLKQPPEYVYSIISKGNILPKYEDVLNASKETENSFLDFATSIYFDNNKNVLRKSHENNEKQKVLETYGLRTKETLLPYLHYVIILGIKSGHLTYYNFLSFLVQHTWIGKPHYKTDLSGNPEITNWINQISPSIVEFFKQVLAARG